MTDIHIQGLRALAESLNRSPTRLGLDTLPLNPPQFVGGRYREFFYRKDIEEVCAALEARDARIEQLLSDLEDLQNDLKWEKEERSDEVKDAAKALKAVEKERDEALDCNQTLRGQLEDARFDLYTRTKERDEIAQKLDRVSQGLWDTIRERDELLDALHPERRTL
jgi:DNA repair exonuclease SbcCD ATPase subunit